MSSARHLELTLHEDHVRNAVEKYLREIQTIREDEEVEIDFKGHVPLTLRIKKEGSSGTEEVKLYKYQG